MGIIRPVFPDGTYVKTNDLTRLVEYNKSQVAGLGGVLQTGILTGLHFATLTGAVGATTIAALSAGSAIASDGSMVIIDAVDAALLTIDVGLASFFPGVKVFLVKAPETAYHTRPNIIGVQKTVSVEEKYTIELSSTTASTSPYVLLGVAGPSAGAGNNYVCLNTMNYNYALEQLTHTGYDTATGKYTGPQLDAHASIQLGTITAAELADDSIGAAQLANNFIDLAVHGGLHTPYMDVRTFFNAEDNQTGGTISYPLSSGGYNTLDCALYVDTYTPSSGSIDDFSAAKRVKANLFRLGRNVIYQFRYEITGSHWSTPSFYTQRWINTSGVLITNYKHNDTYAMSAFTSSEFIWDISESKINTEVTGSGSDVGTGARVWKIIESNTAGSPPAAGSPGQSRFVSVLVIATIRYTNEYAMMSS